MEQIFVAKTRICLCLLFLYSLLVDLLLIMADEKGTGKPNNCTDVLDAYLSIEGQKIDLNSTLCLVTLKENFKSQYSASFCIPRIYVEHTMRAYINEEQINSVTISECCYMDIEADNWTNALLVMQYSEDNGCLRSGTLNCSLTSWWRSL
ncbi:uncharacterized protein LOC129922691 isoform X2 [Biomphalaria glabrata]|uniref:Uncharacterized protein LOC129922691 isoform X2 n=1 Tax=Biomphalaria glabrata TaxID=6526 RepID=A0A9W2YRT1_BIOGL|nr:uncharacterized protein LOC129922691 isoform X2 [Biomphalaria glabrata]